MPEAQRASWQWPQQTSPCSDLELDLLDFLSDFLSFFLESLPSLVLVVVDDTASDPEQQRRQPAGRLCRYRSQNQHRHYPSRYWSQSHRYRQG